MNFDFAQIKCPDFVKDDYPWVNSVYVFVMKPDFYPYPKEYFVSQSGLGQDYHILLLDYMKNFAKGLKGKYEIYCDKDIDEKRLACMAGLGRMCKNNLFYSDKLHSFANIGEILSEDTCEIEPRKKVYHQACEKCDLCERGCPSKSLKNFNYNKSTCVSCISQKKEDLTTNEIALLKNHVYGCDLCLNICPLSNIRLVREDNNLSLEFLSNMTNKEFKEIRNKYPFMWMGRNRISRNAKLAIEYNKRSKKC